MALIQCWECSKLISTEAAACPQCGAPLKQASSAGPNIALLPIQPSQSAEEETIYSDQNVSVTTSRVIIDGTTYALRNITSVRMDVTPPSTGCATLLLMGGIFALIGGLFGFSKDIATGLLGAAVAVASIGGAILWFRSLKSDYHVTIASSSGEENVLTAQSRDYIEHIVNCINEAIVKYR